MNLNRVDVNFSELKLISDISENVAKIIRDKDHLFFREGSEEIVEIISRGDGDSKITTMTASKFTSTMEKYINPQVSKKEGKELILIDKSIGEPTARQILSSEQMKVGLKRIKRILPFQLPIILNGELIKINKGYDNRFESYVSKQSPTIIKPDMSLEEAKKWIEDLFIDVAFKKQNDFTLAVAGLITPMCKGLYEKKIKNSDDKNRNSDDKKIEKNFSFFKAPIFIYLANRERAGKDYCAGFTGILYYGNTEEQTPFVNNKENLKEEEISKKLSGILFLGKNRYHSSNNKGHLSSAVLESAITNSSWSDRLLGGNKILDVENYIDFSLSGNTGFTFSADLQNRSRIINLFLSIENANDRVFSKKTQEWLYENREEMLSAIYTLIRNWNENNRPKGSVPFASFPEWSEIVGGVMENAGYDNPCMLIELDEISGDVITSDFKILFELLYDVYETNFIKMNVIQTFIKETDIDIFSDYELDTPKGKLKFSKEFNKMIGREFSGIKLDVENSKMRTKDRQYSFFKHNNKMRGNNVDSM